MSEPADLLEVAFNDLREAVMPYTKLPGVDAAHTTVRRRRRTRFAAAVAALVVVPLVAFAVFRSPNPVAAPVTPGTNLFPTQTPTSVPPLQPLGVPAAVTIAFGGAVEVPDFGDPGCPNGEVRLLNGVWLASPGSGSTPSAVVDDGVTGDVNGDGRDDLIVALRCSARVDQVGGVTQVVAYAGTSTGDYRLLGQVVRGGAAEDVSSPTITPDGSVRVTVNGDLRARGAKGWRSYHWNGHGFELSGAPLTLPTVPRSNLNLTVTPTVVPGTVTTLAVTVHNGDIAKSDYLVVTIRSKAPMLLGETRMEVPPPTGCESADGCQWQIHFEPVGPGLSATGTFTVLFTGPGNSAGPVDVKVAGWIRGMGEQPNSDGTNEVTVPLGP